MKSLSILGLIVLSPMKGFVHLKVYPLWLVAAGAITLTECFVSLLPHLTGGTALTPEAAYIGVTSIILATNVFEWIYSSVFIILCCHLFLTEATTKSFRDILSVVVNSSIIMLLSLVTSVVLGLANRLLGRTDKLMLVPIVSLDTLLSTIPLTSLIHVFAAEVTVFTLWYMGVLTTGISVVASCNKKSALLIVLFLWLQRTGIAHALKNVLIPYARGTFF